MSKDWRDSPREKLSPETDAFHESLSALQAWLEAKAARNPDDRVMLDDWIESVESARGLIFRAHGLPFDPADRSGFFFGDRELDW